MVGNFTMYGSEEYLYYGLSIPTENDSVNFIRILKKILSATLVILNFCRLGYVANKPFINLLSTILFKTSKRTENNDEMVF